MFVASAFSACHWRAALRPLALYTASTPMQVAKHNTPEDCWVSFHGSVYDLKSLVKVPMIDVVYLILLQAPLGSCITLNMPCCRPPPPLAPPAPACRTTQAHSPFPSSLQQARTSHTGAWLHSLPARAHPTTGQSGVHWGVHAQKPPPGVQCHAQQTAVQAVPSAVLCSAWIPFK